MNKRRVVVTGMGCLTSVGNTVKDFWGSLLTGKSGVSNITSFETDNLPVKFSASVNNFNVEKYLDKKEQRKMDLFMQYGMAAGIDAIANSKLDSCDTLDKDKIGVCIGSGIGGLPNIENTRDVYNKSGARRISPFHYFHLY